MSYQATEPDGLVNLVLVDNGPRRILVIKEIRELFGLGLREAKERSDRVPHLLAEEIPHGLAESHKERLERAGATCRIEVLEAPPAMAVSSAASWVVELNAYPEASRIEVIFLLREHTGLGLTGAKAASESLPFAIQKGLTQEEARQLAEPYLKLGAQLSIYSGQQASLEAMESEPLGRDPKQHDRDPKEYDVILMSVGDRKIETIKLLRELTQEDLARCKEFVERTPSVIGAHLRPRVARSWQSRLAELGASVRVE